jgi:hemerythrin-like domain-containing protein
LGPRSPSLQVARQTSQAWLSSLGALETFARMYEAHTAYEDTIVFQAWKKTLSKTQLGEVGDQFEDIERETFKGDGFDMAVEQIAKIEKRLALHDLGRFTAPAVSAVAGAATERRTP